MGSPDRSGQAIIPLKIKIFIMMKHNFTERAKTALYSDGDLQIPILFLYTYDSIPHELLYRIKYNVDAVIDYCIQTYNLQADDYIVYEHRNSDTDTDTEENQYIHKREKTYVFFLKHGLICECNDYKISFYYNSLTVKLECEKIIEFANTCKIVDKEKKKFFMITKEYNSLDLSEFEVKNCDFEIEKHYNDDFLEIDAIIKKSLDEKNKNGMILLHGVYGTGKTYYLRHLISNINRKFIYLPLYLIDSISSPEFLPFIADHPNSILILEDCENLLLHREHGNMHTNALSNLLNLGDGLLGDALCINIICTFNANIKKVDDAFLRKGRMLARYEFKELAANKATILATQLGKKIPHNQSLSLADIYNLDDKNFQNKKQTIGFTQSIE